MGQDKAGEQTLGAVWELKPGARTPEQVRNMVIGAEKEGDHWRRAGKWSLEQGRNVVDTGLRCVYRTVEQPVSDMVSRRAMQKQSTGAHEIRTRGQLTSW